MAEVFRCDRCGITYDGDSRNHNYTDTLRIGKRGLGKAMDSRVIITKMDLCPNCLKDLEEFLKILKTSKEEVDR